MLKRAAISAVAAVLAATALSTASVAQECFDKAGQGTAPTREAAMSAAYEAVLRATDANLLRAWLAGSRRIGDAPGWTVRKLTNHCTPAGAGQTCRIMATLCKG